MPLLRNFIDSPQGNTDNDWDSYHTMAKGLAGCYYSVVPKYDYGLVCDENTRTLDDWRNTHACPHTVDGSYYEGIYRDWSYECAKNAQKTNPQETRCKGTLADYAFGWNPHGLCHVLQGRILLSTQESCGGKDPRSSTCAGVCM